MPRTKKAILTGNISIDEAATLMSTFAKANTKLDKLNADIDLKCHQIRDKHKDEIEALKLEKDEAFERLQYFASIHPEMFEKKKSIDFAHGTLGFRTGTPKLGTLKGFTWASVLILVKKIMPDFVRLKEEVDKESILAQRNDEHMAACMADCGIEVVQDETFYVESKTEVVGA